MQVKLPSMVYNLTGEFKVNMAAYGMSHTWHQLVAHLGFSAAMLSSMRAVVLLPEAASSLAVMTSVAPPKEGAAPLATAALLAAGCSGAFKSLTASYSSRICRRIGHFACRQYDST